MLPPWPPLRNLRVSKPQITVYPAGATFGPRRMTDYEFVWIIEGESTAYFDEIKIQASPGTILLCRPGITDRYQWASHCKTTHAFFHFNFKLPRQGWPIAAQWPFAQQMPENDILRPLFRYILNIHSLDEPLRSTLLLPSIEMMVRSFVSGKIDLAIKSHNLLPQPIENALEFLNQVIFQDLSRQITHKELAKAAHVSPQYLCQIFRKTLNLTPFQCIQLARLERAATLLKGSNLSIKEVSEMTGFANPYHFSSAFHKTYKHSPRDYRKIVEKGEHIISNPLTRHLKLVVPLTLR